MRRMLAISHWFKTFRSPGESGQAIVLIGAAPLARLAAERLHELGFGDARRLEGDEPAWRQAGLEIVATADDPPDSACIDFVFHTHRRQEDPAHARQYLAWETGLVDQLDEQERNSFRIAAE